ncbi:hypothetical protein GLOIN_2v1489214 [Rhizophagus irregularis DAOM 181602=DAOM 197198]|nr:hypothetical protein GLOIN_2v1489214 [Rhizophagus irregularis DAOM 181602=DAOM 197198]
MGKKRHECCRDHKLSVFFGGKNTKELKGIKSKDVKGWLKNRFSYNFIHVRKDPDWGCLIVDIFIFNVKNLSVDVNINNTKLIFVKFEYDLLKDPEGSHCLLKEAVFPDKEVILNLELPKRQVYILN